jgi:stearoyl-CoA desaturase (delta-9 desaturase)
MGWMLQKDPDRVDPKPYGRDFENDSLVQFQHKHYVIIASLMCFGLPTLIGYFLGSALGGLAIAGFLRLVLVHHATFFINSLCHYWGSQPYGNKTSARDNFVMAFLTYGEGYHNFHHRFQIDYRNGIKWYQWDPTKWLIWFSSRFGMTTNLRRVDDVEILKARVRADEYAIRLKGISEERLNAMMERLISTRTRIKELQESYRQLKLDLARSYDERWEEMAQRHKSRVRMLKAEIGLARLEFKMAMAQWKLVKNASILGSF